MKKLKKLSIKECRAELAVIGEHEAKSYLGGYVSFYTAAQSSTYVFNAHAQWADFSSGGGGGGMHISALDSSNSTGGTNQGTIGTTGSGCQQCDNWHQMNSGQPSMDPTHSNTMPLGQYLLNTLPHQMGWGNHTPYSGK